MPLRHNRFSVIRLIRALRIILVNIIFFDHTAVDQNLTVTHLNSITAGRDNAFDKIAAFILRITENDDLTLFRLGKEIFILADDQALVAFQRRIHRRTLDHIRLYHKRTDTKSQRYGYNDRNQPVADSILPRCS